MSTLRVSVIALLLLLLATAVQGTSYYFCPETDDDNATKDCRDFWDSPFLRTFCDDISELGDLIKEWEALEIRSYLASDDIGLPRTCLKRDKSYFTGEYKYDYFHIHNDARHHIKDDKRHM